MRSIAFPKKTAVSEGRATALCVIPVKYSCLGCAAEVGIDGISQDRFGIIARAAGPQYYVSTNGEPDMWKTTNARLVSAACFPRGIPAQ